MIFIEKKLNVFLFGLIFLWGRKLYAQFPDLFPYYRYCYRNAVLQEKSGHSLEARNWYFRYIEIRKNEINISSDPEFSSVEKRLIELKQVDPVVWIQIEDKKKFEKNRRKFKLEEFSAELKEKPHRERRKPSLSPQELAAKADKAELAGQFATARRYYRLVLRLDPKMSGINEKIKRLDEVLTP